MKVQLHNGVDAWVIDCVYVRVYDGIALFAGSGMADVSVPMDCRQARFDVYMQKLVIEGVQR